MREDCKKYFEKISEYVDGELDGKLCHKIETHLKECPECQNCLDSLKKTIRLCKKAAEEKVPTDIKERLRSTLRKCFGNESK